jgi:hypothetical protein
MLAIKSNGEEIADVTQLPLESPHTATAKSTHPIDSSVVTHQVVAMVYSTQIHHNESVYPMLDISVLNGMPRISNSIWESAKNVITLCHVEIDKPDEEINSTSSTAVALEVMTEANDIVNAEGHDPKYSNMNLYHEDTTADITVMDADAIIEATDSVENKAGEGNPVVAVKDSAETAKEQTAVDEDIYTNPTTTLEITTVNSRGETASANTATGLRFSKGLRAPISKPLNL